MCGARIGDDVQTPEPEPTPEPMPEPEPMTEPEPTPEPMSEPEPVTEPEPMQEPMSEPEPDTESAAEYNMRESASEAYDKARSVYEDTDTVQSAEGSVIMNHCPHCGAVLISGARFCSNCGYPADAADTAVPKTYKRSNTKTAAVIAAIAAVIVIILGGSFLMSCRDIEGDWEIMNNSGDFFDMFGESYLEFDDDGTAVYYNGLFNVQKYAYSYNRITKTLILKGRGTNDEDSRLKVEWHDSRTVTIPQLNMTLSRIDDIPYAYDDDKYDSDDIMQF